jgi:hypothetical protein
MPGTTPETVSTLVVTPLPATNETFAEVFSVSGECPASSSVCESAIAKQEACAAARNSSGVVAPPSSARAFQVRSKVEPVPSVVVPEPLPSPPVQLVLAFEVMAMVVLLDVASAPSLPTCSGYASRLTGDRARALMDA